MEKNRFEGFNKKELAELYSALVSHNEYLESEVSWDNRSQSLKSYYIDRHDINTALLFELMEAARN